MIKDPEKRQLPDSSGWALSAVTCVRMREGGGSSVTRATEGQLPPEWAQGRETLPGVSGDSGPAHTDLGPLAPRLHKSKFLLLSPGLWVLPWQLQKPWPSPPWRIQGPHQPSWHYLSFVGCPGLLHGFILPEVQEGREGPMVAAPGPLVDCVHTAPGVLTAPPSSLHVGPWVVRNSIELPRWTYNLCITRSHVAELWEVHVDPDTVTSWACLLDPLGTPRC